MFETGRLTDRRPTPAETLAETPIFHALRSAETPIFHALLSGATAGRHQVRPVAERVDGPELDPMARFRRDPLTAPIPLQAYVEAERPATSRPRRAHAQRAGRHRLLAPA